MILKYHSGQHCSNELSQKSPKKTTHSSRSSSNTFHGFADNEDHILVLCDNLNLQRRSGMIFSARINHILWGIQQIIIFSWCRKAGNYSTISSPSFSFKGSGGLGILGVFFKQRLTSSRLIRVSNVMAREWG